MDEIQAVVFSRLEGVEDRLGVLEEHEASGHLKQLGEQVLARTEGARAEREAVVKWLRSHDDDIFVDAHEIAGCVEREEHLK